MRQIYIWRPRESACAANFHLYEVDKNKLDAETCPVRPALQEIELTMRTQCLFAIVWRRVPLFLRNVWSTRVATCAASFLL